MATHTYGHLKRKEARYLANLFGIECDLESTIDWCKKYVILKKNRELIWLIEPITVAILIRFIRPFESGVIAKDAKPLLKTLDDSQEVQYKYFKNIRNLHIAHSINGYENNYVKACYIEEAPEKGIQSINKESIRIIGLSSNETNQIENICTALLQRLKQEIEIEKKRLLEHTKKFTVKDIKEMKTCIRKHPNDIDESKGRK